MESVHDSPGTKGLPEGELRFLAGGNPGSKYRSSTPPPCEWESTRTSYRPRRKPQPQHSKVKPHQSSRLMVVWTNYRRIIDSFILTERGLLYIQRKTTRSHHTTPHYTDHTKQNSEQRNGSIESMESNQANMIKEQ